MTETGDLPGSAERAEVRTGVVIAVLVVSAFVMILNETIMSVALPHLVDDLDVSASTAQWLTSGFLLTMAVVIPTTGYLLERFASREIFVAAMVLFSVGTFVCAIAPGFPVLLLGRIVQAGGTAVMIPLLMTTVMRLVPAERRGAMMGTISIVIAVAPAIGPTVSGAILSSLSWRWMFWLVLPLSLLSLAAGVIHLRVPGKGRPVPLDALSVVLSALGFSGLVYGFAAVTGGEHGGGELPIPAWIPLSVGIVSLGCFVVRQLALQRRERALLDLRVFTHRPFVVAAILSCVLFMALIGAAAVLLPLYLQDVLGYGTFATGLALLPGGLVMGMLARPVGRLFDRIGARPLVIPGAMAMAASLCLLTLLGGDSPLWAVIAIHVLFMGSLGVMMTPLITEPLAILPAHLYSHGSATLTTLQQVSGAFGAAILVMIASRAADDPDGSPDAAGMQVAFGVAAALGLVAVFVAFFIRRRRPDSGAPVASEPSPEGLVLAGRVTLTEPAEAVVTVVDMRGRHHIRARTVDGRYRLVLPDGGAWQLVASAPGHAPWTDLVHGHPDTAEVVHDVVLSTS